MRVSLVLILVVAALAVGWRQLPFSSSQPPLRDRLVIAVAQQPLSSLLFLAEQRGYFIDEGLDVELRPYSHGKKALAALDTEVDLATVADVPFVTAARERRGVVAIATIESSDRQNFILARADRGITRARDLIGKRVAIIPGTSSQAFLDAFLIAYSIPKRNLELVLLTPETIGPAFEQGKVDAVSLWALPAAMLTEKPGANFRVFGDEGLYVHNWILVAHKERATLKQAQIQKLLRALLRAEEFEAERREQAIKIVADRLGITEAQLTRVWPNFNFNVGLHQYFLLSLEMHERLIRQHPLDAETNFVTTMMFEPLEAVDPTRITAIH